MYLELFIFVIFLDFLWNYEQLLRVLLYTTMAWAAKMAIPSSVFKIVNFISNVRKISSCLYPILNPWNQNLSSNYRLICQMRKKLSEKKIGFKRVKCIHNVRKDEHCI